MPRALRWSTLLLSLVLLSAASQNATAQGYCSTCNGGHGAGILPGHGLTYASYGPVRSAGQDYALGKQAIHQAVHPHPVNCLPRQYPNPDLFYNYYAPATCGGVPAQMYLAPYETPELVGHTWYTYQPFLPHEHLYQHHRTYRHNYNHNLGMTRTAAVYWSSPVKSALWKGWVKLGFPQD
jgi:hypothetical protein